MNAPARPPAVSRRNLLLAGLLIALAALAAYHGTFAVPFLFDDQAAITRSASIKNLTDLGAVLTPEGVTIGGRPLLNLTFALNYALSGYAVPGYHVVNLAIHVLAALTLFGVLRRSLAAARPADAAHEALPLATLITLLWAVHPLSTSAVTYLSQRAESLMALFYLLTLYGFIRAPASPRPARWLGLSVLCCFAGMATKEVMVTAPVLVLLYDRVFFASSFRDALARRPRYYAGLAASWLLLGCLMFSSRLGERTVGFGAGVSPLHYALTEFKVVVLYLKLALWPHPLVFDYGREMLVRDPLAVAPHALLVLAALAGTAFLFVRGRMALGFTAAAFFILLSPTSSFVPIAEQPMAESRMYLPLAAVLTLAVLALHRAFGRRAWFALAALVPLLVALTVARNRDFRSGIGLWTDTLAKRPASSRGHYNLASELEPFPARQAEKLAHYEAALRLRPDYPAAHNNLAVALAKIPGRLPEALAHFATALRLKPDAAATHNNLATILARLPGRLPEALAHYEAALRAKPDYAVAHFNLGFELARLPGRQAEAIAHYETALRLKPDFILAHVNLANELASLPGRRPDAVAHFETVLRLRPDLAQVHFLLANTLAQLPGRLPEAAAHYETALRLRPGYAEAHFNLAQTLARMPRRTPGAIAHYEAALRLEPTMAEAHYGLALLLARSGRREQAVNHLEAALWTKPAYPQARAALERLRAGQLP